MKTPVNKKRAGAAVHAGRSTNDRGSAEKAIGAEVPGLADFAAMLSPAGDEFLEQMAQKAQLLTKRHFGRTVSLYVPLYLSNFCSGGCAYCGFALDREQPRRRLNQDELVSECRAIKKMGFEDVLLLTGDRCRQDDFAYLLASVKIGAQHFHTVTVESFAMTEAEYASLAKAGCSGITIYQETYDPVLYRILHKRGEKSNYEWRLDAPSRALSAGMRTVGLGVLLGLTDPVSDLISLFRHAEQLRKKYWQAGILLSFPRICPQFGDYQPAYPVDDRFLARTIFAFRICFPDTPIVLSTREQPSFRDNMAGVGVTRMSIASRTTVGGYAQQPKAPKARQFDVGDTRNVATFCRALRSKDLEPVFKNWDAALQLRALSTP
ncbi:MAG: 2-iminoacetate synthase ThiH [bacterium]